MANIVNVLIEKPKTLMTANVPSTTTGTAMVGIMVARQFCRNKNMTRNTRITASTSVCTTDSIESLINGVVSNANLSDIPVG